MEKSSNIKGILFGIGAGITALLIIALISGGIIYKTANPVDLVYTASAICAFGCGAVSGFVSSKICKSPIAGLIVSVILGGILLFINALVATEKSIFTMPLILISGGAAVFALQALKKPKAKKHKPHKSVKKRK